MKHLKGKTEVKYELNVYLEDGQFLCSCGVNGRALEINMANTGRIVKTWNSHDELLEALKKITDQFERVEPLYTKDKMIIDKAKQAIKNTE